MELSNESYAQTFLRPTSEVAANGGVDVCDAKMPLTIMKSKHILSGYIPAVMNVDIQKNYLRAERLCKKASAIILY